MIRVIVKEFPNDIRMFDYAIPKEENKKEAIEYATNKKSMLTSLGYPYCVYIQELQYIDGNIQNSEFITILKL